MKAVANLENWTGDVEDLDGHEDELGIDPDLCERVFASKHEAFTAGFGLGIRCNRRGNRMATTAPQTSD